MIDRLRAAPHGFQWGSGSEVTRPKHHFSQSDYMACEKKYKLSKIAGNRHPEGSLTSGEADRSD
jgi:hypothetical protein